MRQTNRGFALIAAIILIVVAAVMAVTMATMLSSSTQSGGMHVSSAQALFAAESGIEQATRLFKNGTSCANLAATIGTQTVGSASYTVSAGTQNLNTTIAAGGIDPSQTSIPTNTVDLSAAGYASHGRIVVDGEQIVYTGLSGNSFTGALRGFAGTAAAAHLVNAPVIQNQCLVRATGASGQSLRILESAIQNGPWSDFLDGVSTPVPSGAGGGSVGGLVTALPAGDNLIIAMVAMRKTTNPIRTINAGNLQLRRGAVTLASNLYAIDVGGNLPPNATRFPQKTYFFVHKDTGVAANQTYSINAQASGAGIDAEVKMLVINNPPNSATQTTQSANAGNGVLNTILSYATPASFPAGDNIVIASVQWNNNAGACGACDRAIAAGDLLLDRSGGPTFAANEFQISIRRTGGVNDNGGMLLVGRDANAPAGANTYRVRARANNANVQVEAKLIVISGVASTRVDGGSFALAAAPTSLGPLNTTFPNLALGGSNLVIASTQYDNAAAATLNIAAGGENIVFSGNQSSNEFQIDLCTTGTAVCDDFATGLMWRQTVNSSATASPSFDLRAAASAAASINGEAKILGIHLNPIADWVEIFP